MALGNGYITQALPFAGGIYTRAFLAFHGFEHLYFGASVPISMSKHVWEDVQTIGVGTCVVYLFKMSRFSGLLSG